MSSLANPTPRRWSSLAGHGVPSIVSLSVWLLISCASASSTSARTDAGSACDGVSCDAPPQSVCRDGMTLRTFASKGTCQGGGCIYAATERSCDSGCGDGACLNEPCAGVSCASPPAQRCLDRTTLRTFADAGACLGGGCAYAATDVTCAQGCAQGACLADACIGIACDAPPNGTCVDRTTLRTFGNTGVCSGGSCTYAASEQTCAFGCLAGACAHNPCDAVTCNAAPESTCVDSTTRRTFVSAATCSNGSCVFAPTDEPCGVSSLCVAGGCVPNDSRLSALSLSDGSLAFDPDVTTYVVTVASTVMSVHMTAVGRADQSLIINGATVNSGAPAVVGLGASPTTATIRVESASGSSRTYSVVFLKMNPVNGVPHQQAYVKASNAESLDVFSTALALSVDGNTLAIGAPDEDSSAHGVNGDQSDNSAEHSGAAYVFTRSGSAWTQQAYLKASNGAAGDGFGESVVMSADGNTLVIGAPDKEISAVTSGAVFVFTRAAGVWTEQAHLEATNPVASDRFGRDVALSADGNTLATLEQSIVATPLRIFSRTGSAWTQTASLTVRYGSALAMSADGLTLAVGTADDQKAVVFMRSGNTWSAQGEVQVPFGQTGATFVAVALSADGNVLAVGSPNREVVHLFVRSAQSWALRSVLQLSVQGFSSGFGFSLALSADGKSLVVGAQQEDSRAIGINGDSTDHSSTASGAAYVFADDGATWSLAAYVKASNTAASDLFGFALSLSGDGHTLAIGAPHEDSSSVGVNGEQTIRLSTNSGAVYVFDR